MSASQHKWLAAETDLQARCRLAQQVGGLQADLVQARRELLELRTVSGLASAIGCLCDISAEQAAELTYAVSRALNSEDTERCSTSLEAVADELQELAKNHDRAEPDDGYREDTDPADAYFVAVPA